MKKTIVTIIVIVLTILVATALDRGVDMHRRNRGKPPVFCNWGRENKVPLITDPEKAVEVTRQLLDEKTMETITNLRSPDVTEVMFSENPDKYLTDKKEDISGRPLYKVVYTTELDGLLGPIVFYVDRQTGRVVAMDYRE